MRITHVQVPVPDPVASAAFYADVLGVGVSPAAGCGAARAGGDANTADGVGGVGGTAGLCARAVQLGATTLVLVRDPHADPLMQHLAITVPGDAGRRAHDWLRERVRVLAHAGSTLLEASAGWQAQSVYFRAPDGTVLELIARRRLAGDLGDTAFGPQALLAVSEVGLAVPDVAVAAARLERAFGLRAFGGPPSSSFGAVGDDEGLLVLVRTGRTWFPTRDAVAGPEEVHVRISGTPAGSIDVNGLATVTGGSPTGQA
ncbi:Glyoxalase/bleomycin resistance protein/dioxygenase [Kineococcus radiotolerans SRS30216 = ATCC BAA-149]|uniref:Glyoxalase/bleomycin resistance protein/dioxygenase n=1 Tax=Kineococcus radiotolerans (strain ATCC BAA-149 / DSM 14245 / SRS30216) TaxID=266940 RepID=A6WBH0_KINRD|nr:Glyoxalase/bleomycin resistance protein/dioxygenase [Kineococcus radiotolerans SRS30216 = ATCC BAA-149]